jgi:thiamine-phosphate pyrophosphorylase
MNLRAALTGLYAILDRPDEQLAHALVDPARGGARVLQLRWKPAPSEPQPTLAQQHAAALMARSVAHAAGAVFIVDDHLDLALVVGADGVHLGQTDQPLASARRQLAAIHRRLWIGVSTHDLAQVEAAVAGGADYLGFGPVFATATKLNPDPVVGLDGLRAAVLAAGATPVVAIGGIDLGTAAAVAATGAAAACVIRAVNGAADPAHAAREVSNHWKARA